jgi:hypothetical protein
MQNPLGSSVRPRGELLGSDVRSTVSAKCFAKDPSQIT